MPGISIGVTTRAAVATTVTHRVTTQVVTVAYEWDRHVRMLRDLYPGEPVSPEADCPKCGEILTVLDIVEGFSQDPQDFDTTCPICQHRFPANLKAYNGTFDERAVSAVRFYCKDQVSAMLRRRGVARLDELDKALVASARFHFYSLAEAYAKVGLDYKEPPVPEWRKKLILYFGQVPDTVIAKAAGLDRSTVSKARRKMGIPAYRRKRGESRRLLPSG